MRHARALWLWASDHATVTLPWAVGELAEGIRGGWLAQHRDWQARQARERNRP